MTASSPQKSEKNKFSFPKKERLCSEKSIQKLFKIRKSIYLHPFKLYYLSSNISEVTQFPKVLFSVPKRNFKKAVDRNNIKRKLREAYRLNKAAIFSQPFKNFPVQVAFIYTSKENLDYHLLEEKLIHILFRLKDTH